MMLKHCLCAVLLLALAATATARTSVVVVHDGKDVILGADSLVRLDAELVGSRATYSQACKIQQVGNVFFVVAGVYGSSEAGFDARDALRDAAEAGGTPEEIVNRFAEATKEPLTATWEHIKRVRPDIYAQKAEAKDGVILGAVVVGVERDSPRFVLVEFMASKNGPRPVIYSIKRCPGDCDPSATMYALGHKAGIARALRESPNLIAGLTPAESVKRLVELEIAAEGADVGGPVDLLRVTKNGARWEAKKSECPAIALHAAASGNKTAPVIIIAAVVFLALSLYVLKSRLRLRRRSTR